ncbi:hypothetical protein D3C78_785250 [compost metagenome]
MAAAVQAHGVFHAEDFSQRQVLRPADLLPDQVGGERATGGQGLGGARQGDIAVVLQGGHGIPGGGQVGHVQQLVDAFAPRQPLGFRQLAAGFVLQRLEQAVELRRGLVLPVELHQAVDQGILLVFQEEAVGQVQVQGVMGVDGAGTQAEEQAELARQAGEEPTAADIGVEADVDFRHAEAAGGGDDADRGALHQAHAATQDMAMGPADQRLGIGVDAVVEAVFVGEETACQRRHHAGVLAAGVHQAAHVATGAEGLGPVAAQQHADDLRVLGPGAQFRIQGFDHRQGQGIQAGFGIQAGDADAGAMQAVAFFETHIHGHIVRLSVICCANAARVSPGRR